MTSGPIGKMASGPMFSFVYDGKPVAPPLEGWKRAEQTASLGADREKTVVAYTDPKTGLRVTCETVACKDFAATDWLLYFENTGGADTPIIENVQALDATFSKPMPGAEPFVLHRTVGGLTMAVDFEMHREVLAGDSAFELAAGDGRSSNKDFPFFRIDTGAGTAIVAVGWSGQWKSTLQCRAGKSLRVTAGLETTHFKLHPGERVRSPRILVLCWDGDPVESHNQFRRLIAKHYVAPLDGKRPERPFLFCNTCFTRGGIWLNECNEENQISLIRALAPLGVKSVITDAGWFKGGWPYGAGNWTPREDAYPNGMGPVAAAAKECGMAYGLWFEPERVVGGTTIDREHPDWLFKIKDNQWNTGLLNLALPEARQYFLDIVGGFMRLPGFRVYRQDFNMNPLAYWRENEAEDRKGVVEMKYIEGLYAYWDAIGAAWPDSFREECASGGRRIDLETIQRMHVHQKSDLWFNNEVDQGSILGLSHYLPNGVISVPTNRLDDYSVHSAFPSSLIVGWIADAPDFDTARAKEITERYRKVRRLFNADFYALTDYSRDPEHWLASQYNSPERGEGLVLAFRREKCEVSTFWARLRGVDPAATYEVTSLVTKESRKVKGEALMQGLEVRIPDAPGTDLLVYRKA